MVMHDVSLLVGGVSLGLCIAILFSELTRK